MVGSGLDAIGRVGQGFVREYQDREDEAAVNEFRSKLNDWESSTIFDPEKGAISKRGQDAFDLPKVIPEEFDKFVETNATGAYSPRAREAIGRIAASRRGQLQDWSNRHSGQEREQYFNQQFAANNITSARRAASLAGDRAMVEAELLQLRARTQGFYKNRGASVEEIDGRMYEEETKFHSGVMANLFAQDNYAGATEYFSVYSTRMTTDDMARYRTQLSNMERKRAVLSGVDEVIKVAGPMAMRDASPVDNLHAIVLNLESGGQRWDPDTGSILRSSKGAEGEMQVMPDTQLDPGYGVVPARDNSPEEIARVGRDYIDAMVREYRGDVPKALAAYNAGPGAVGKALLRAQNEGGEWLSYLPEETQNYVRNGVKAYNSMETRPKTPNAADYEDMLRARFQDPEALQAARAELNLRLKLEEDALKRDREDAKERAILLIDQGTPVDAIPRDIFTRIDPSALPGLRTYAKAVTNGADVPTDWELYHDLASDPRALQRTNLLAVRDRLGETEFKELTRLKFRLEKGEGWQSILSRKDYTKELMRSAGIKVDTKDGKKQLGEFMGMMAQRTNDDTPQQQYEATARRLLTEVKISGLIFDSDVPAFKVKDEQIPLVQVPDASRQAIIASLNRQGHAVNEENIRKLYILGLRQ